MKKAIIYILVPVFSIFISCKNYGNHRPDSTDSNYYYYSFYGHTPDGEHTITGSSTAYSPKGCMLTLRRLKELVRESARKDCEEIQGITIMTFQTITKEQYDSAKAFYQSDDDTAFSLTCAKPLYKRVIVDTEKTRYKDIIVTLGDHN